jgi:HEPN domain-containing protein
MRDRATKVEETLEWIRYGDEDLRSAADLLNAADPVTRSVLFHCQQAIEKWLKAFLIWHDVAFPKVHDLHKIGAMCVAIVGDLKQTIAPVAELTGFATVYRYPGAEIEVGPEDAREWLHQSERVRAAVLEKLPADIRDAV